MPTVALNDTLFLTPYAAVSAERLRAHLMRKTGAEQFVEDRLINALNAATAWVETYTGRNIVARNYREPQDADGCTVTVDSTVANMIVQVVGNVTTSFETQAKVGDPMFGDNLEIGTLVVDIAAGGASLTMTREAVGTTTDTDTSQTITFGDGALRCSGSGTELLDACEFPIQELWSAEWKTSSGSWEALDITGADTDSDIGVILLQNAIFPKGERNIRLQCRAGYESPSELSAGSREWYQLERLWLRCGEIFYQDDNVLRGRVSDLSVGQMNSRIDGFSMPTDVLAMAQPFVRTFP